jgi:hypothetical protein
VFVCVCVQRTLNALWLPELSGDERREKDGMELEMTYEWLAHVRAATLIELWSELNGELVTTRAGAEATAADVKVKEFDRVSGAEVVMDFAGDEKQPRGQS